ncbi:MAG: DUF1439 domain-containing protein [Azonexus sp.]|jgi:hypothetical protein|nr:DUF1439 domain-containing protein [Azonexus sp.]
MTAVSTVRDVALDHELFARGCGVIGRLALIAKIIVLSFFLLAVPARSAGFLEHEITFSEADVQAQVDKNRRIEKSYGQGAVIVALDEPPRIHLGEPEGRLTVSARLILTLLGQPAAPVDVVGVAGMRYDEGGKAFYLDQPEIRSLHSPSLSPAAEPLAQQAISQLMGHYFRLQPVYVLRQDGSASELAARWLLRSIRIEPGRVVAVLSAG